jgi:hypothetical protein
MRGAGSDEQGHLSGQRPDLAGTLACRGAASSTEKRYRPDPTLSTIAPSTFSVGIKNFEDVLNRDCGVSRSTTSGLRTARFNGRSSSPASRTSTAAEGNASRHDIDMRLAAQNSWPTACSRRRAQRLVHGRRALPHPTGLGFILGDRKDYVVVDLVRVRVPTRRTEHRRSITELLEGHERSGSLGAPLITSTSAIRSLLSPKQHGAAPRLDPERSRGAGVDLLLSVSATPQVPPTRSSRRRMGLD